MSGGSDVRSGLIDAVFLTSDSREQALECVAHLREPEIASVVVVDNASTDGTAKAVLATYPDVTVLTLEPSSGLASALNRGAEHGDAPFVLYLNDDVFAAPGSIRLLLTTLQGCGDAVAASGRLAEHDLTTQDRYRPREFPSPATVVARLLGLERLWPRNPWTGGHLRSVLDDCTTVAVDQPAGACLLVRRSVVELVGGWDERYWFWYEDVDFARRLSAHGSRLYVPTAPFRHVGGSTARRLSRAEGHRRNFHGVLVYAGTHFSAPGRALVGATLAAIGVARALLSVRSDRGAARTYVQTARAAVALAASRPVIGLRDVTGTTGPRPSANGAACLVCGLTAVATDRFRPTSLYACPGCGLLFGAADHDPATTQQMYSDDSYSVERLDALTCHRGHDAEQRACWVRGRVAGRRLLDVGAGAGFFVQRAAEHGFEAVGVEPSNLSASYARDELGVDVRTGFLDTSDLPGREFDVVCMWHVLEHATDPLALLRDVHARLRPDGRIVIEVPNIDSVGADLRRGRWAHLDPAAHVCHFTPRSLTIALQRAGYEVLELQTLIESYYDHRSMRLRPRRIAGRVVRAVRLSSTASTHPSRGELLRVVAKPTP